MDIAKLIVDILSQQPTSFVKKIAVAVPGFINFYLSDDAFYILVQEVLEAGEKLWAY